MNRQQTIEMNHYESDPPSQDIYETLHSKPAETRYRYVEVQQSPHRKKLVFILLAANSLLLVTILVIVAVHYHHVSQSPRFATNNEEWYLHDDTFYLFWSGQGSCEEAKGFCIQRGAQLLTVDSNNEAWVKSVVRGKQVFVEKSPSAGYGISCGKDFHDVCDIFPSGTNVPGSHGPAGWVCQRWTSPARYLQVPCNY
nr:uncharacterized protein LOC111860899 isoform X2 [Paramormyrops kingsleyae]